jgi:hypothetical protein
MLDQEIIYWRWSVFYHLEKIFYDDQASATYEYNPLIIL